MEDVQSSYSKCQQGLARPGVLMAPQVVSVVRTHCRNTSQAHGHEGKTQSETVASESCPVYSPPSEAPGRESDL